jgi:hypothetical protein
MSKTVIQIVREHLVAGGFDGLCLPDAECGCLLTDFHPCGESFGQCVPGYKRDDPDSPGDWLVCTEKELTPTRTHSGEPVGD